MDADSFHRLAKLLLDTGEATSIAQALDNFGRYGVRIRLTPEVIHDAGRQILALTAINCAARSFQGNVLIEGPDFEIIAPGFQGTRLYAFLDWAGVKSQVPMDAAGWPRIIVHGERIDRRDLVAWSAGWEFGIGTAPRATAEFAPACVAAAGLAVSEAFSILRADNPYAGHRCIRLSLWDPAQHPETCSGSVRVPTQEALWLIGLGHLGQAYAWTLGFLRAGVQPLVLQDIDLVSESTLSTSMVSHPSDRGQKKTRVVARWLEARGYQTTLVERRFDETQRVRPEEPGTALFGLDNAAARRVLEAAGFRLAIDAGLGAGYSDFRALRVRAFPGPSSAATLWASDFDSRTPLAPAYLRLLESGAEPCGVTMLATRAVGAPFVGCVAAGYVLAERIRRQIGGRPFGFLDMHLREPDRAESG